MNNSKSARLRAALAASGALLWSACGGSQTAVAYANGDEPINLAVETREAKDLPPVAKVVLSSTLEGEIGDGGFDTQIVSGSGTFFAPDVVQQCGRQIASWANDWADSHSLQVLVVSDGADRAVVHVAAPNGAGFFRFYYSRADNGSEASGSLTFHDLDGNSTTISPTDFPTLDLDKLAGQMKKVMECAHS